MDPRPPLTPDRLGLAPFLRAHRLEILEEWQRRVGSLPPARGLSRQELLNHLPHLLDRIAAMVDDLEHGREVRDPGPAADQHALERLDEGYDLEQVVWEFAALRQCVLDMWAAQPHRTVGTPVLNQAIDEAVSVAVSKYTAARERTLIALDRIAAASLEAADLGALLDALTRVLLETTAAVDSVALYLMDGPTLTLRAAVGLEQALARRLVVEVGSATTAGRIAAAREPLELRDAARSALASEALRRGGARAFYGVPMLHDGEVVGVAKVSSCSAFEFSKEDKLLFRSMVERATTAIIHRRLHDALEQERLRLAAVLDALPVAVWVSDQDGRVLRTNRVTKEIWGAAVPEPQSFAAYEAFRAWHTDGRPVKPEEWPLARALRERARVAPEEVEVERFDRGRAVVLMSGSPIRNEQGEVVGAVAVNVDVTARRSAEEARRESEERFRNLADSIAQLAWMADETGYIFWYNRRWYDFTGTTFEQMQGWGWKQVHHPDHLERVVEKFRRHLESGEPWEDTFPLRGRDGGFRWFLSRALPIRDPATGRVVRWCGTNTDITESKRIEDERAAAVEREREARTIAERAAAMIDALFVAAPIGLAFFDLEGRYVRVNETLAAMNGVPAEEHAGRTIREVVPHASESLEPILRRVRDTGEPVTNLEFVLPSPLGPAADREWQLSVYPVRRADGILVGLGGAVVEITALKQALRARDEFLSVASHDLRSPLTSMKVLVESILRRAGPGVEHVDRAWLLRKLEKVRDQINRVSGLLEDLLDVSRIRAGRINLELTDVDVATMVRDVAARHFELLASSGCELRLDVRGHVVGRWDALRLEQVVTNLLTNAAKYGAGGPVEVRLGATGERVRLSVQDHGVGIAPEHQRQIFEQFERAGDRAAFKGTGLGLWIVKRFVEAMGGSITVESALGAGATFTVELPRTPAEARQGEGAPSGP